MGSDFGRRESGFANAGIELYAGEIGRPVAVTFDRAADGQVATYFARWGTAKGEVGPWSAPVSMRIAA